MPGNSGPISVPKKTGSTSGGFRGVPEFKEASENTTPGIEQTLITHTVANGFINDLHNVHLTCNFPGLLRITADGLEVGSGRTEAGKPDTNFFWTPARPVDEDLEIKVLFKHETGTQAVNVKAFLQMSKVDKATI